MENFFERLGYRLEPRANISNLKVLLITTLAILVAFIITAILIASFGVNPFNAYAIIIQKTLFNSRGFSEVLRKSIPLMLAGVGLVLAFRAQFWNIGAEGQILAGAFAASGLALFVPLPAVLMIPAMFLAGFIAGGLWGFLPALLKVKLGVNEIITTLMMNYIALYTIRWLINGPWKGHKANSTGFSYSDKFLREYWLPTLGRTRLHWPTLLIAVLFAIFVAFLLARMKFGFEIRIMGESPNAAKYAGINFFSTTIGLMLLAAGAAGLAGVGEVAGIHHRLIEPNSISLGYGYTAIIVALLARGNPIAAIFSALFLGWVFASGDIMRVSLHLPSQIVGVINGLILLSIIAVEPIIKNRFIKIKKGA
ncbi:MAG TPA: ABC transporter permease [Trueperaceae bacterium]|nr:ABC transporter permease [Trueperaceae bacterium]